MEAVIQNAVLAHSYAAESNLCGAQLEAVDLTGQAPGDARGQGSRAAGQSHSPGCGFVEILVPTGANLTRALCRSSKLTNVPVRQLDTPQMFRLLWKPRFFNQAVHIRHASSRGQFGHGSPCRNFSRRCEDRCISFSGDGRFALVGCTFWGVIFARSLWSLLVVFHDELGPDMH